MSRPIEIGDLVELSLSGVTEEYLITEINMPYIKISSMEDINRKRLVRIRYLMYTDQGWKLSGSENVPYDITFRAKPISSGEAADICSNFILRTRRMDEYTLEEIRNFVRTYNLPLGEDAESLCKEVLKKILRDQNIPLNVDRMRVQDLARTHEHEKEKERKREEQLRLIEIETQRRSNLANLVAVTKEQILKEETDQYKAQFINKNSCLNTPTLKNVNLIPLINVELIGRRVTIPSNYWRLLFDPSFQRDLSQNPNIQIEIFNRLKQFPEGWSNEQVIDVLGKNEVRRLTGSSISRGPTSGGPIYLQIDSDKYAMISGYDIDDDFINISTLTSTEFENISKPVTVKDCLLDPVALIELRLTRSPLVPDVDENIVKAALMDKFAELGILTVGDILTLTFPEGQFTYYIQNLTTINGQEVYAAALPAVPTDVNLSVSIETKEELQRKLASRISEPIDEDLI